MHIIFALYTGKPYLFLDGLQYACVIGEQIKKSGCRCDYFVLALLSVKCNCKTRLTFNANVDLICYFV